MTHTERVQALQVWEVGSTVYNFVNSQQRYRNRKY